MSDDTETKAYRTEIKRKAIFVNDFGIYKLTAR